MVKKDRNTQGEGVTLLQIIPQGCGDGLVHPRRAHCV